MNRLPSLLPMKALLIVLLPVLLSGCMVYGSGEAEGYVYGTEDGLIWDHVFFKTELDSSNDHCLIVGYDILREELRSVSSKKVRVKFDNHFWAWTFCSGRELTAIEPLLP